MLIIEDKSMPALEPRMYLRFNEGVPQLVRVAPLGNELGWFNADKVAVYVDEGEATYVSIHSLQMLLDEAGCSPLDGGWGGKQGKVH